MYDIIYYDEKNTTQVCDDTKITTIFKVYNIGIIGTYYKFSNFI